MENHLSNKFKKVSLILVFTLIFLNINVISSKALSEIEVKSDWTIQYDLSLDKLTVTSGTFNTDNHRFSVKNFYQNGGTTLLKGENTSVSGSLNLNEGIIEVYGNLTINGDLYINGGVLKLNGASLTVNGNVHMNGGEVYLGKGNMYINKNSVNYGGNLYFSNGLMDLQGGNVTVQRDVEQKDGSFDGVKSVGSVLNIDEGNLSVDGNYSIKDFSKLIMQRPSDFILVKGDFLINTYTQHALNLNDGILELKGNFSQKNFSKEVNINGQKFTLEQNDNFLPKGNYKVILSGTKKQVISFDGGNICQFNILELKNNLFSDYDMINVRWNKLIESIKPSTSTDLMDITINGYKVKDLKSDIINYNLNLPLNTEEPVLNVEVKPYDKDASVTVEGNKLVNKAAMVKIIVTAADNSTKKVYYVNVQLKQAVASSGFIDIKTSNAHSLALKNDGTLYGFGENNFGQLGDGTLETRLTPVQVSSITDVVDFDTSSSHSIAVTGDGSVWVWGLNDYGQLKESDHKDILAPIKVEGLPYIQEVRAGNRYSLVLDRHGKVWMFGYNQSGQFGDETEEYSLKPRLVMGLENIKHISAGEYHCLALDDEGKIFSWGANDYGQLGDGTVNAKYTPLNISGLSKVKYISAKENTSSCVKEDGTVLYWGQAAFSLEGSLKAPKELYGVKDAKQVCANDNHIILTKKDGKAFSMGFNDYGQLGDDTKVNKNSVTEVKEVKNSQNISLGGYSTSLVTQDGFLYTWGNNDKGQLGIDKNGSSYALPQIVKDFKEPVSAVYASYDSGKVNKGTNIELKSDAQFARIYYTLDGSTPTEKSNFYYKPITIKEHTTLKAIAVSDDKISPVSVFDYIIKNDSIEGISINIASAYGITGKTVEVPITFSQVPSNGVYSLKFAVKFNPEVLKLESVDSGQIVKDKKDFTYSYLSKDKILLEFSDKSKGSRTIHSDGVFALLKFTIKDSASEGRYVVMQDFYAYEKWYDESLTTINTFYNHGYVDVKSLLYGDVNGDGKVTALDFQYVQRYILKRISVFPSDKGFKAADIDGDGKITDKDLKLIQKIILNN